MNKNDLAPAVRETEMPRRRFLRNSMLLAAPVALMAAGVSPAFAALYQPPSRARGSAVLNARDWGAYGDGVHDDTTALQNAINALPADGGTLYVPAGTYLIDAERKLRLRGSMHLQLAPDAVLRAKPNAVERAYVLIAFNVSDLEISGGRIIGERDDHIGTTGQWGHGIMIRGCTRVTIRDIHVSKCFGDGISLGSAMLATGGPYKACSEVAIANVVSTGNRRHALTIGGARHVYVYDSEFSSSAGVPFPACGIDMEADAVGPTSYHIHVENCLIANNEGNGIEVHDKTSGIVVQRCKIHSNNSYGVVSVGVSDVYVASNSIRYNGLAGVAVRSGCNNHQISRNSFYYNCKRFHKTTPTLQTQATTIYGYRYDGHTEISESTDIRVTYNDYYDATFLNRFL